MKEKYQLFSKKGGEALLPSQPPEAHLRDFVARHLKMMFGTILIGTEYQVRTKRIDVVGLTEDGRPVLIECKKHKGVGIVDQITYYYRLLRSKPEFMELAINESRGRGHNLDKPRLICLAESFTDAQLGAYDERKEAGEQLIANTEFVVHRWFAKDIMLLDWVRGTPSDTAHEESPAKPRETDSSLNYILSVCNNSSLEFFENLNAYIIALGEDVVSRDSKHLRRFARGGEIFAYLRPIPRRDQMCVWLKLNPKDENPQGEKHVDWMRDVSKIGKLPPSGFDLELKIKNNPSQRKRAKELIQKAYDQANR